MGIVGDGRKEEGEVDEGEEGGEVRWRGSRVEGE